MLPFRCHAADVVAPKKREASKREALRLARREKEGGPPGPERCRPARLGVMLVGGPAAVIGISAGWLVPPRLTSPGLFQSLYSASAITDRRKRRRQAGPVQSEGGSAGRGRGDEREAREASACSVAPEGPSSLRGEGLGMVSRTHVRVRGSLQGAPRTGPSEQPWCAPWEPLSCGLNAPLQLAELRLSVFRNSLVHADCILSPEPPRFSVFFSIIELSHCHTMSHHMQS